MFETKDRILNNKQRYASEKQAQKVAFARAASRSR